MDKINPDAAAGEQDEAKKTALGFVISGGRARSANAANSSTSAVPKPSDVIALVVLWRLRYKLSLRDLAEMFLTPLRADRIVFHSRLRLYERQSAEILSGRLLMVAPKKGNSDVSE